MLSHAQSSRLNTYHTPKQRILGNPSAHPAPAWRPNARAANTDPGSKILLSRLPLDVEENEVETLFTRTVGPVKEVLMVYNSQGNSRGMAVVTFARAADASVARGKYNGKIVDGRRPIRIEIVIDDEEVHRIPPPPATGAPSLLERLGPPKVFQPAALPHPRQHIAPAKGAPQLPQQQQPPPPTGPHNVKGKLRAKKGPRRLNKQRQAQPAKQPPKKKTAEELDKEMEDYKARAAGNKIKTSESATFMMQLV
ncbi:hypothetical protein VTO73DRAFT_15334 [Trametes versicolor]